VCPADRLTKVQPDSEAAGGANLGVTLATLAGIGFTPPRKEQTMSESSDNWRTRRRVLVGIPLATGLVLGAVVIAGHGGAAATAQASATPPAATRLISLKNPQYGAERIYKRDSPGVVDIVTTERAVSAANGLSPFGPVAQASKAEGTGFVYNKSGDIITADHVVSGASKIVVNFQDGTTATATLVGADPSTDTAVIKVAPRSQLVPLAFADSATVEPGQGIVAIGSAFGYPETITAGIVSAVDRGISGLNGYTIPNAIQTDAPINHGNSGGPLIDASGKVIAIADQLPAQSSSNAGVGFAVPANSVKTAADDIIAGKAIEHPYLGIALGDAVAPPGAKVGIVRASSPAATAGLKVGDIVTRIDAATVTNAEQLTAIVSGRKPGDVVHLTVDRNGTTLTVDVTLGTRPTTTTT
jgi:putative serine protease PepD